VIPGNVNLSQNPTIPPTAGTDGMSVFYPLPLAWMSQVRQSHFVQVSFTSGNVNGAAGIVCCLSLNVLQLYGQEFLVYDSGVSPPSPNWSYHRRRWNGLTNPFYSTPLFADGTDFTPTSFQTQPTTIRMEAIDNGSSWTITFFRNGIQSTTNPTFTTSAFGPGMPALFGFFRGGMQFTNFSAGPLGPIVVPPLQPMMITDPAGNTLPNATTGTTYFFQFAASGGIPFTPGPGRPEYDWTIISGIQPQGVNFALGVLLGAPAAGSAGTYIFTVRASDSALPPNFVDRQVTLIVT
jgi:hypothetical protein